MYKIIAVMPCYKSSAIAPALVKDVIKLVDKLICVDDACPESTGKKIRKAISSEKLEVIFMILIKELVEQ